MQLATPNFYTKDIKKNGRGYILADSAIIDGLVWSQSLSYMSTLHGYDNGRGSFEHYAVTVAGVVYGPGCNVQPQPVF